MIGGIKNMVQKNLKVPQSHGLTTFKMLDVTLGLILPARRKINSTLTEFN
jgi:hypothetical protein